MFYFSAWVVGFLGSFHCAGMCGPLAMALPVNRDKPASMFAGRLLYNAGRITTYMLLGLVAGLLGHALSIAGFQKTLSIGSGILILLVAILSLAHSRIYVLSQGMARFTGAIKRRFKKPVQ
jgi:sulfite exporter TauE/SafE